MPCKRCGAAHFNFTTCAQHAVTVAERKRREKSPDRFLRKREGERDFGNRLYSSEVNGFNVVYIPRKEHPLYSPPKDAA